MNNRRIIIIGGNAAGPAAAAKAKRVNPNSDVIIFEAGDYISTGTCELPYLLSGEIKDYRELVFFEPDSFFREKGVRVFTRHLVENINRQKKSLSVKNVNNGKIHEFNYDKLILTTGSLPNKLLQIPSNVENVFFLKSLKDYLQIQHYLKNHPVRKILIIGAGYVGLEAADAIKKLGFEVSIFDKAKLPMPSFDLELQNLAHELITTNDLKFSGSIEDLRFIIDNNKIKSIHHQGRIIDFDLILISSGFKPNNSLAFASKIKLGEYGGIKIDNRLRTSDINIYAAGDNIEVINKITGKPEFMPLATIAHNYGHIAGTNSAGGNLIAEPVIKNIAVKFFNKVMISVGLNSIEAKKFSVKTKSVSAIINNLVPIMPGSRKIFGKIIFDSNTRKILGAQFLGGSEVSGYGDLISTLIFEKNNVDDLSRLSFNYTPPVSPFVNILSVLGRKAIKEN